MVVSSSLEKSSSLITNAVLGTTAAAAVVGVVWMLQKRREEAKKRQRTRSWSFTSQAMALGSFPPHIQFPEPVINATLLFDDCPDSDQVANSVVKEMLKYERFGSIPLPEQGTSRPCDNLDPAKMIRRIVIHGDDQLTFDTIQLHLHDPVIEGRDDLPWWEVLIIQNNGAGCSACVMRIHHSLADGISLVTVMEHIITYADGTPLQSLLPPGMKAKFQNRKPWWELVWSSLIASIQVLTLAATPFDDDTVFSKASHQTMIHNHDRSLLRFHTMPLDFVKELKNAAKVTINDILFTCLSQAIHDYLIQENCPVFLSKGTHVRCRALLPVAFPRPSRITNDKSQTLRNKWCFVSSSMGIGEKDILSRLHFVHTHLSGIKTSPLAAVQLAVQNCLPPMLPMTINRKVVFDTFCRHSIVFSNVPGPDRPCCFAGKEVTGVQMFFSNLIPQVGLISYRGQIFGNMCLDPIAIPNSESISHLYSRAFVLLAEELHVTVPESVRLHSQQQ